MVIILVEGGDDGFVCIHGQLAVTVGGNIVA